MTVDEVIAALTQGKTEGRWNGDQELKMQARFPQTITIDAVEAASESPGMYSADCVVLS
jgi:hypothetical protein